MTPLLCLPILLGLTLAYPQSPPAIVRSADDFEIIILHNNDMHARFEQTNKYSSECSGSEAAQNHCFGGFARVAHV
jgi:5'-nucleotidase